MDRTGMKKLKEVQLAFYKEKNNKETYCTHFKHKFIQVSVASFLRRGEE